MRLTTVAFALIVTLTNTGYAQEAGNLPEECKPLVMELQVSINSLLANVDSLEADKAEVGRLLELNNQYREGAQRLLIKHEMLLQIVDSTIALFDERGELLQDQVSDYEKLSDVLYQTCIENVIGNGPRKWKIYAALIIGGIGGLVVGLAL